MRVFCLLWLYFLPSSCAPVTSHSLASARECVNQHLQTKLDQGWQNLPHDVTPDDGNLAKLVRSLLRLILRDGLVEQWPGYLHLGWHCFADSGAHAFFCMSYLNRAPPAGITCKFVHGCL